MKVNEGASGILKEAHEIDQILDELILDVDEAEERKIARAEEKNGR